MSGDNGAHRTTNLYEAAYLLCREFKLAGKERQGQRMVVVFGPDERLRQAVLDYYSGATVEARKFADRYRSLKDYLFANTTEQEVNAHGIHSDPKGRDPGVRLAPRP